MKVTCQCGHLLIDSSDSHSHKARLIPDQRWLEIFDGVDETVLKPLETGLIREPAASMRSRELISKSTRVLYQCCECGRLYVNDHGGVLHCFLPADDSVPRSLLSGDGTHG